MEISIKGMLEIASYEGLCLSKYLDSVGVWTIGLGATKSEIPDLAKWPLNRTITIEQAVVMFVHSLKKYQQGVRNALTVDVTQEQFDALCSICYNIGVGGLQGSTFIKRINRKESIQRISDAIMLWTKQPELIKRRSRERDLFVYGKYTNLGNVNLFPVNPVNSHPIYSRGKIVNIAKYFEGIMPAVQPEVVVVPEVIKAAPPPMKVDVVPKDGGEWPEWLKKVLLGW